MYFLITGLLIILLGRYPISLLLSSGKTECPRFEIEEVETFMCNSGNVYSVTIERNTGAKQIVFLHGLNSSSIEWGYQRNFFKTDYELFLIDLPGHGNSTTYHDMSVGVIAADLKILFSGLNIEQPVLYGHSMGGMVILEYIRQNSLTLDLNSVILQHTTFTNPYDTSAFARLLGNGRSKFIHLLLLFFKNISPIYRFISWICYTSGISCLFYRYLYFTGRHSAGDLRMLAKLAAKCSPAAVADALL